MFVRAKTRGERDNLTYGVDGIPHPCLGLAVPVIMARRGLPPPRFTPCLAYQAKRAGLRTRPQPRRLNRLR